MAVQIPDSSSIPTRRTEFQSVNPPKSDQQYCRRVGGKKGQRKCKFLQDEEYLPPVAVVANCGTPFSRISTARGEKSS